MSNDDNMTFNEMDRRLRKIYVVLNDPYKSIECKYSLIEDIMNGRYAVLD